MATIGNLVVTVGANTSRFTKGLRDARGEAKMFGMSLGKLKAGIIGTGIAAGTASVAFVGWGIKLAAASERAQTAFETMLKSSTLAKKMMDDIRAFAASTPFQQMDLIGAAQRLLAFGSAADDIMPQLQMLGDLAAGSGARINDLVGIYGKVNAIGKASLENINQLAERGIPIYATLKEQLGLTGEELRKFISSGKVTAEVYNQALQSMIDKGGIFFGSMVKQSKTLSGLWSTLKDNVAQLAEGLGLLLLPAIKALVTFTTMLVQAMNKLLGIAKDVGNATKAQQKPKVAQQQPMLFAPIPDIPMDVGIAIAKPIATAIGQAIKKTPILLGAVQKGSAGALKALETVRQQAKLNRMQENNLKEQKIHTRLLQSIDKATREGGITLAVAQI